MGDIAALGSLAFSTLALASACFCLLRGAPTRLELNAREALSTAQDTRLRLEAFLAEANTILGAVQEERERTIRAQRRASADRVKVEGAQDNSGGGSRDEQLISLRREAGLI